MYSAGGPNPIIGLSENLVDAVNISFLLKQVKTSIGGCFWQKSDGEESIYLVEVAFAFLICAQLEYI